MFREERVALAFKHVQGQSYDVKWHSVEARTRAMLRCHRAAQPDLRAMDAQPVPAAGDLTNSRKDAVFYLIGAAAEDGETN